MTKHFTIGQRKFFTTIVQVGQGYHASLYRDGKEIRTARGSDPEALHQQMVEYAKSQR